MGHVMMTTYLSSEKLSRLQFGVPNETSSSLSIYIYNSRNSKVSMPSYKYKKQLENHQG